MIKRHVALSRQGGGASPDAKGDALAQAIGAPSAPSDTAAVQVLHALFQRQGDPLGERYAVAQV